MWSFYKGTTALTLNIFFSLQHIAVNVIGATQDFTWIPHAVAYEVHTGPLNGNHLGSLFKIQLYDHTARICYTQVG